jgi:hypothetical protein
MTGSEAILNDVVTSSDRFVCRVCSVVGTGVLVLFVAFGAGALNVNTSQGHAVHSSLLDNSEVFGDGGLSTGEDGWTQALGDLVDLAVQAESKTKPVGTPQDSRETKAIVAKLDEPMAMEFPDATPFEEVLAYIKKTSKKRADDPGIPIYIDPLGLREVGSTLTSVVRINERSAPLKVSLARIGDQLGFAYTIKDDVLIISSPTRIRQEINETSDFAKDALPKTHEVMAKLARPIAMPFDTDIPLDDVLKYIKKATKGSPNDPEIAVILVPSGLEQAKASLNSTVIMNIEGVSLRTSLRLLLKQCGLAYVVKEGRVIINTPEGVRKLK